MQFQLNKGMALAIRAIFGIEPEKVESQLNDAAQLFIFARDAIHQFDKRLSDMEATQRRLVQLMEGNHNAARPNGKLDHSTTAGNSAAHSGETQPHE